MVEAPGEDRDATAEVRQLTAALQFRRVNRAADSVPCIEFHGPAQSRKVRVVTVPAPA